jgi:hypothetical protein
MPESHVFCSVCGGNRNDEETPSVPEEPIIPETCTSGHQMDASHAFCSVCGATRDAAPGTTPSSGSALGGPTAKHGLSPIARATLLAVIGVVVVIIVLVLTLGGGSKSQSYKDGWNTGVDPTQNVDCNNWTAPSGDDETQWVQGCNDGTSAYNNAVNSYNSPPTTYP